MVEVDSVEDLDTIAPTLRSAVALGLKLELTWAAYDVPVEWFEEEDSAFLEAVIRLDFMGTVRAPDFDAHEANVEELHPAVEYLPPDTVGMARSRMRALVLRCPNLEHLSYLCFDIEPGVRFPSADELPHLRRKLTVETLDWRGDVSETLAQLMDPRSVVAGLYIDEDILDLMPRDLPSLRALTASGYLGAPGLRTLMRKCPHLRELRGMATLPGSESNGQNMWLVHGPFSPQQYLRLGPRCTLSPGLKVVQFAVESLHDAVLNLREYEGVVGLDLTIATRDSDFSNVSLPCAFASLVDVSITILTSAYIAIFTDFEIRAKSIYVVSPPFTPTRLCTREDDVYTTVDAGGPDTLWDNTLFGKRNCMSFDTAERMLHFPTPLVYENKMGVRASWS